MPPAKPKQENTSDRVKVLDAVKDPLRFFALVVLVVEVALGALAAKTEGHNQLIALYSMVTIILTLIVAVSICAFYKPEALTGDRSAGNPQLRDFGSRIIGYWWEQIKPDTSSALSIVEICFDSATGTLKMKGNAYGRDGNLEADWETIASCINLHEKKVFYYWRGLHHSAPGAPFEGFGELTFHEFPEGINSGFGVFSDTNVTDLKSTAKKSVELRRCTEEERQLLQKGDAKLISERILKKLGALT